MIQVRPGYSESSSLHLFRFPRSRLERDPNSVRPSLPCAFYSISPDLPLPFVTVGANDRVPEDPTEASDVQSTRINPLNYVNLHVDVQKSRTASLYLRLSVSVLRLAYNSR